MSATLHESLSRPLRPVAQPKRFPSNVYMQ